MLSRIDVPVIHGHVDAALVLMKRRFHWSFMDIFYSTQLIESSKSPTTTTLSSDASAVILSERVSRGDLLLFEAMNTSWWSQPELKAKDFWEEVRPILL